MNERNKYLSIVKDFVLEFLEGEDVKIFLFGSRARLDHNNRSDIVWQQAYIYIRSIIVFKS